MTTMLKKISPKSLGCQKIGDGYKIFGNIGVAKQVTTDKGESVQLFGSFRAIVDETGEVFEGVSTFLPGGYDALFASQLRQAQDNAKGAFIELAAHFEKKAASNPMGCEWIMTLLSKNSGGASMLDQIQSAALPSPRDQLKLAAPKKVAAKK